MPLGPTRVYARQLRRAIEQVKDVTSARVVLDDAGDIDEIHVVGSARREAKRIVRDIESLLYAQFGLRVGELAGDLLRVVLVVPQLRIGGLHLQLADAAAQLVQIHHLLNGGEGGVQGVKVSGDIGVHSCREYRLTRWRR